MSVLDQQIPALPATGLVVPKATLDAMRDALNELQAPWEPWIPVLTAVTLGAGGSVLARYRRVGETIDFRLRITLGTGGAFTGTVGISPPVPQRADYASSDAIGVATFVDASAGVASRTGGTVAMSSTLDSFVLLVDRANPASVAAAVPWTWAINDTLSAVGRYEAAA